MDFKKTKTCQRLERLGEINTKNGDHYVLIIASSTTFDNELNDSQREWLENLWRESCEIYGKEMIPYLCRANNPQDGDEMTHEKARDRSIMAAVRHAQLSISLLSQMKFDDDSDLI